LKKTSNKHKPSPGEAVFSCPDELRKKLDEYFGSYLADKGEIADIESLADFLGITREELISHMGDENYGSLLRVARNRIAKIKKQLAFNGKLQATVLAFDLKNNHGYKDKPEESEIESDPVVFKGKTGNWAK
jgi:hypothetical protein